MKIILILFLLIIPGSIGLAHGHTIDAVEEYRVEIGWMNVHTLNFLNPLILPSNK